MKRRSELSSGSEMQKNMPLRCRVGNVIFYLPPAFHPAPGSHTPLKQVLVVSEMNLFTSELLICASQKQEFHF